MLHWDGTQFAWARGEAERKKKLDLSAVELMPLCEGTCVQCLHVGPYDSEPATVKAMHDFAAAHDYAVDLTEKRRHYEIYLGNPRKTAPEKLKTVVRHPVRPA